MTTNDPGPAAGVRPDQEPDRADRGPGRPDRPDRQHLHDGGPAPRPRRLGLRAAGGRAGLEITALAGLWSPRTRAFFCPAAPATGVAADTNTAAPVTSVAVDAREATPATAAAQNAREAALTR